MERYNYLEAIKEDVKQYMEDNHYSLEEYEAEELEELLNEECWIVDSVTGNASGSYTFSRWQAEEYICHNLDLALEAYTEFGHKGIDDTEPEYIDVTIRCYLLGRAIAEVIKDMKKYMMYHEISNNCKAYAIQQLKRVLGYDPEPADILHAILDYHLKVAEF